MAYLLSENLGLEQKLEFPCEAERSFSVNLYINGNRWTKACVYEDVEEAKETFISWYKGDRKQDFCINFDDYTGGITIEWSDHPEGVLIRNNETTELFLFSYEEVISLLSPDKKLFP